MAAHDLHVFESRSLQVLAGGPEELAARSPLLAAGRITAPVLLLHCIDDIVIPCPPELGELENVRCRFWPRSR